MMDAGCAINIPFPPLLRGERRCDFILALDQSAGRDQYLSTNLQLAADYAAYYKLPFPDVSAAVRVESQSQSKGSAEERSMSAASMQPITLCPGDVAAGVPTIAYMSMLRNEQFDASFDPRTAEFCATTNWTYTPEQIDQLTGLTAFNTRQSIEQLRTAIRAMLEAKRAPKPTPMPVVQPDVQPILESPTPPASSDATSPDPAEADLSPMSPNAGAVQPM